MCEDPYLGQFCDVCSGSDICNENNCDSNRDCANCVLDILVPLADETLVVDFFSEGNPDLPEGSVMTFNPETNAMEIMLPPGHCSGCSDGAVIINGTSRADYEIDGESLAHNQYSGYTANGD